MKIDECLQYYYRGLNQNLTEAPQTKIRKALPGIFLIGEKTTAEGKSLPTQGSLRQLLREFFVFCRFGVINSGLFFYLDYITILAFLTLKFSP